MYFFYFIIYFILYFLVFDIVSGFLYWFDSCHYFGEIGYIENSTIIYVLMMISIYLLSCIINWYMWLLYNVTTLLYIYKIKYTTEPKHIQYNNYCVLSNYTNYILDTISFWRYIEYIIYILIGWKPLSRNELIEEYIETINV